MLININLCKFFNYICIFAVLYTIYMVNKIEFNNENMKIIK
jgi:hypothetical protein